MLPKRALVDNLDQEKMKSAAAWPNAVSCLDVFGSDLEFRYIYDVNPGKD